MDVLTVARAWHHAGASVVPARGDGTKAPAGFWKRYQGQRPDLADLDAWLATSDGFGLICGAVSGNLEMLEVEGRATALVADVEAILTDSGHGELWRRLSGGYLEVTPSGGLHWLYRVDGELVPPSRKLARRPATAAELAERPDDRVKVLFETRGEGGFTVVAPSAGRTHPSGRAWMVLAGGPASVPTITAEERRILHAVIAGFDQMPAVGEPEAYDPLTAAGPQQPTGALRPGDDYNATGTWQEILEPHGWKRVRRLGRGWAWVRPGKEARDGISATTGQNAEHDRLYVFSTSTVFEAERPYSKFGAYALLEHGGDHAAAAKALAAQGYGERRDATTAYANLTAPDRMSDQPWQQREGAGSETAATDGTAPLNPTGTAVSHASTVDSAEPASSTQSSDDETERALAFNRAVHEELTKLQVREAAKDRYASERAAQVAIPDLVRLDRYLAEPDPEVTYRVDGLWPADGRVVFAAQFKAGKTTAVGNLLRSLADGDPFLDAHPTQQVGGVVLLDNELGDNMLRRWCRKHAISAADRVHLASLKGRLSSFNILQPQTRSLWAQRLKGADVVIFDCLRPALDALGLDENRDAGRFLEAFDEMLLEAGISEAVIVHHMGHNGERSRGDSRILDWPDALWKLIKEQSEDGTAETRYFTAYGRDVDQPEQRLGYDDATKRLFVAGGTRADRKGESALNAVLAFLGESDEPLSGRAIEAALAGDHTRAAVRDAMRRAIDNRVVTAFEGPRRAVLHVLNDASAPVRRSAPRRTGALASECASAPIGRGALTLADPLAEVSGSAHSSPTHCTRCGQQLSIAQQARGATLCPGCDS